MSVRSRDETIDRIALALGFVAGFLRVWLAWSMEPITLTENMRVGIALGTRGQFADPFFTSTGPTAHVAPLYPGIIAGGIYASGSVTTGLLLGRSFLGLLLGAGIALFPRLASAVGFSKDVGLLAALIMFLPKPGVFSWLEMTGQHETVVTAVSLAAMTAATLWCYGARKLHFRSASWLGLGWGLGMHASPTLVLPMLAVVLVPAILHKANRTALRRTLTVLTTSFGVAIAPWIIRNAVVMGTPVFVRDNFGMEIAMSNADDATADMRENMLERRTMTRHPYFSAAAAVELRKQGEIAFNKQKQVEAVRWVKQHPSRFAQLTLERIRLFFLPKLGLEHHAYFYLPLFLFWILGSFLVARSNPVVALTLNAALFAYGAPHFVVQSSPRYSYPVLWIMLLFACHAMLVLWHRTVSLFRASSGAQSVTTS